MSLKTEINMFLEINYKNASTKETARNALEKISHLEKIDIDKINEIYKNIPMKNYSKSTQLGYITKFIKYKSTAEGRFYDTTRLITFENNSMPKQVYNQNEIEMLTKELINFNNLQFELIFKLMLYNGCRLSEFVSVNWKEMRAKNYECAIKTKKGGHPRIIVVPKELICDFEKIGIDYSYNTIQNLFGRFHKFVVEKHPEFTKAISSHCLRRQRITNMFLCGMSVEQIQVVTGHAQINTITEHYIKTSSAQMKQFLQLGNIEPLDTLEITKLNSFISAQNKQILALNLDKDMLLDKIKNLEIANERLKNEITDLKRTKIEYQSSISETKTNNFSNMERALPNPIS
uniref:Int n=1 Tax=Metamycoplasma arthritidis TaxID=2111 RepID=Q53VN0_METAT|nr:Int [Mycoplasma phage MAV1] [Metamycoplasma arthritidis]AAT66155.1 Int [Mycoplasma phage MAV1] [Metamycoplasma arthritidis]